MPDKKTTDEILIEVQKRLNRIEKNLRDEIKTLKTDLSESKEYQRSSVNIISMLNENTKCMAERIDKLEAERKLNGKTVLTDKN